MYYQHDWQVILQFGLSTEWHTVNNIKIRHFVFAFLFLKFCVAQECIKINLTFHSCRGIIHSSPMNKNWEHITRFFKMNFYWHIVALQWHIGFCWAAHWIDSAYSCTPSFLDFLPMQVTTDPWVQFPELYRRFSLVSCFIHNCVYMSAPVSQHPNLPPWHPCVPCLCLCLSWNILSWNIPWTEEPSRVYNT